ncbi:MAG TPA: 30S ribosomal protein S6 [Candidatus Andersenbacteria bacterium]|nr:30S ribosomal protein S6 [Candidatus Andersenbacteria bacterium]
MPEYEITYLANPQLSEADKDKLDETIERALGEVNGEISSSTPPTASPGSRRRLHYPIAGHRLAWLRTVQVNLDPAHAEPLRQTIKKQAGVLRVSMLATPARQSVSAAIFDHLASRSKQPTEAAESKPAVPAKPVTMAEVEEKIEKALEEEVK